MMSARWLIRGGIFAKWKELCVGKFSVTGNRNAGDLGVTLRVAFILITPAQKEPLGKALVARPVCVIILK